MTFLRKESSCINTDIWSRKLPNQSDVDPTSTSVKFPYLISLSTFTSRDHVHLFHEISVTSRK